MANGDDRTAQEIRQSGDEMSISDLYAGQSTHGNSEPDMSMYENEDDPRWYETDDSEEDPSVTEPESTFDQQTFNSRLEQWAQDWTAQQQQQTPDAQALAIVDQRVQAHLSELQQAQEWAAQGEAERQDRAEIRAAQQELNEQEEGGAMMAQIAEQTAMQLGLPKADPDAIQAEANALFNSEALQYLNSGGSPEGWAAREQDLATRCVEQAAINLGRQTISDNALKKI